jgi:UDP-N-acetylmuramoyl-tripeptide--D-alanyl-D-alanine ligase
MLTLAFVLETLTNYLPSGDEPSISSFVIDSREAQPGSLFVAFRGDQVDGHDFVDDAFARGAITALVEREVTCQAQVLDIRGGLETGGPDQEAVPLPCCLRVENTERALQSLAKAWRRRFSDVRVIGITGSVGKTTTKEMVHSVLSRRYRTLKSEGNYNNEIGLPLSILELRPWHQRAVLEMGMYTTGEISLLCEVAQPHVGVVTIVGSVHMEWLGSLSAIARAKRELVEALPPAPEGVAILNIDDPLVMEMADHTAARVFTYGLDPEADLWADNIVSRGLEGVHFTMHHGRDKLNVQVPLLGRHSVHTALRATAVGLVEGLAWDDIVSGLQGLTSQLRLVAVTGPKGSIILDDTYNSSPESAMAALNLLEELTGRRIAILGDMLELGPVEESSHRLVGRRARDAAHLLITVGRLGRIIGEEALAAGMPPEQVSLVDSTDEAVALLRARVEEGDIILVKGSRGARLDRIVSALGQD